MQNSKDIQELIYRTIENISKELINKTNYLYLVEGKVTEIDTLGNCYVFKYQDEDYVGFSITGEKYKIGDLIYVLFSNNKDVKKMILSKTKAFSNNDIRRLVMSAQSSADEAKENAQEALDRIQEIGQDGNISPNEKLMIKKDWENIKIEYAQVIEEIELYGGSENKILKPLKEQYNNNYIALKSYIEPILEDLTSSSKIESAEFLEKFNNYYSVRQGIAQAIADITKTIADETQELAKINEKLLADIANDDKLTPSEKQSVLKEFQGIIAEYKVIIEQAKYYGLIYTNYDRSYNELLEYLNPLLENLNSTSDITGIIFRQYFINYYTERQKLQKSISDRAKDIADEAENIANEALENTKLLSIEADGQIFSKTSDSEDFYPNYISLSVKTNVVTFNKFQYKTSNTDWQDVISEEHGFTIVGEILTISKDSDLFTSSNNNITIQALSSDSSIKDIFTIIKVQDGVVGENALSVILTNEAHVFPAGVSAALNSSTETEILAFDGASPTEVEIVSISTLPLGLTAQISNNNTLKPKITFTATTLLTEVKDVIITIRVKNTKIQRHFSYTLGLKGEPGDPGENAWSIVLGNDSQNIPCNSNGVTNTTLTVDIPVYTYYGTLMVASTLSVGTLPSGIIATSITNGTTSAPGNVQLTFSNNINLGGKDSGTIDININASNKKFIKKFSWSKTKQGDSGRVYLLESSSLVIKKGSDNVLNPSNITFQSYYRDGTSATRTVYSGRFIIQESTDGDNYTTKYTSSVDESSKIYTPSSSNIKSIKCILYAAGGTTTQLDSQTVVVLTDVDNIEIGGRNYALNTSSDWSYWFTPAADVADSYNVFSFANMPDTLKIGDIYTLSIELEWSKFTTSTIKAMTAMLQLIPYVYENNNTITLSGELNNGVLELDGDVEYSNSILTVKDNNFISDWVYNTNYIDLYDLTDMMLKGNNTIRIEKQITFETKEQTDITKYGIAIRCNYSNGTGKIRARKIKLEIGNKATDWSSAPEDVQESISNSKQEAIEVSNAYTDVKEKEIISNVENVKTVVDNHTTAISIVQSSIQQTQNKVDTVFTQTEEIRNLTDENSSQLQQYKQYISMEPVKHEGETEARPTITLGQSTSSFKVAIDNKEIAFTGASGEKVAYITGDELRINNVVVVKKLAIGDFYLEQEQNNHLVLKKGG